MSEAQRIVLLTARDDLRHGVLRLAALAGAEVDLAADSVGMKALWSAAGMVIVGHDLAGVVAQGRLPRRDRVIVVASPDPGEDLWRTTVALGASRLLVLPSDENELVELMSDALEGSPNRSSILGVIGGCGGAGASTLAAALALTSARSGSALLIDGDRFGGGLDVLLGAEQRAGIRWSDLAAARGRLGVAALTESLPVVDGLSVLSWGRRETAELAPDAAAAVMNAAARGFASVVVDLPRRFDAGTAVLAGAVDSVVMIVPATVRATAAAASISAQARVECPRLRLVVRDPGAGRLTASHVGEALALPVVATLRSDTAVASAAERGDLPLRRRGSLYDACRALLAGGGTESATA